MLLSELSPRAAMPGSRLWVGTLDCPGRADVAPPPRPFRRSQPMVPCAGPALLQPGPCSGVRSRLGPPTVDGVAGPGFKEVSLCYYHRVTRALRALSNRARMDTTVRGGGLPPRRSSPTLGVVWCIQADEGDGRWFTAEEAAWCSHRCGSMGPVDPGSPTRRRRR